MSLTKLPFDIVWGFSIHHSSKSMKCLRIAWLKRGTTCSKFGEYTTKSGTYLIGSSSRLPAALPPENYTTIISDPWSLVFFQVLNHLTMPRLFWNRWLLGHPMWPFWCLLTLEAHTDPVENSASGSCQLFVYKQRFGEHDMKSCNLVKWPLMYIFHLV